MPRYGDRGKERRTEDPSRRLEMQGGRFILISEYLADRTLALSEASGRRLTGSGGLRKREEERRTRSDHALDPDASTVRFDDTLADR